MKLIKSLFLVLFLNSLFTFGQAITNGSTLTVTDLTGGYVYYEHNINLSGAFVSSSGPGAPLNTPIRIKISSSGTSINPYFTTGDLNGNCDSFLIGSMNSTNTQFTTTLNSCCTSIAEGFANGLHFGIPIKCATPIGGTGSSCVTYNLSNACNLYCISFFLQSTSTICKNKNYTVVIGFADGTSTTIIVNFSLNNTVFCFPKPITSIISSTFSNCNCGTLPRLTNISETTNNIKQIIVSPNPTNSIIKFSGENLEKYNVTIYDSNGTKIIDHSKIDAEISLEKQKKGVYLFIIEDNNGYRQESKIIKE